MPVREFWWSYIIIVKKANFIATNGKRVLGVIEVGFGKGPLVV